ncbi:MAG: phosphomethylpyrimidine kinase, partial [Oscillospiraceae bacterium]
MNRPQRVLAIHDMSGFGRCSLTVIIPALSAMGMQVCPVPTAVISTHLGGFGDVGIKDLTDFLPMVLEHYKRLNLEFECIYTGFLSCCEQVDSCKGFMEHWNNAVKVVDPVMGDNGRTYVSQGVK